MFNALISEKSKMLKAGKHPTATHFGAFFDQKLQPLPYRKDRGVDVIRAILQQLGGHVRER